MEADKESIFSFTIQPTTMQLWRFFVHYANDGVRKAVNVILVGGSLLILLVGRRERTANAPSAFCSRSFPRVAAGNAVS